MSKISHLTHRLRDLLVLFVVAIPTMAFATNHPVTINANGSTNPSSVHFIATTYNEVHTVTISTVAGYAINDSSISTAYPSLWKKTTLTSFTYTALQPGQHSATISGHIRPTGGGGGPGPPPPLIPFSFGALGKYYIVNVTPASLYVCKDGTLSVQAQVSDGTGTVNCSGTCTWTATIGTFNPNPSTITSGTTTSTMTATGNAGDKSKITASCAITDSDGDSATIVGESEEVTVVKVDFNPVELRICTDGVSTSTYHGEEKQTTATIVPSTVTIFFESSNTNIITVLPTSGTGTVQLTVTAKGVGTAVVRARLGSITGPICKTLSVTTQKPNELALVSITQLSCSPQIGDKEKRIMNVKDTNGEIIDITGCFVSETFPELICSDHTGGAGTPTPTSGDNSSSQIIDTQSFCTDQDPTPPTFEEGFCYSFTQIISVVGVSLTPTFTHNYERIDGETIELNTTPF